MHVSTRGLCVQSISSHDSPLIIQSQATTIRHKESSPIGIETFILKPMSWNHTVLNLSSQFCIHYLSYFLSSGRDSIFNQLLK